MFGHMDMSHAYRFCELTIFSIATCKINKIIITRFAYITKSIGVLLKIPIHKQNSIASYMASDITKAVMYM